MGTYFNWDLMVKEALERTEEFFELLEEIDTQEEK